MAVRISYFSWVRERMGRSDEVLELPGEVRSVAGLIDWLAQRDAAGRAAFADPIRIRAALDGAMVGSAATITGAKEIALFPPVTGG